MNLYEILKKWYEYKAEHSDLTGTHTDFIFFCIDLNNRLAWKETFGLPAIETANFLNISYNTFRKVFKDLTEKHKLIRLVQKSKNQYQSNIISLDLLYQNLAKQNKSSYKAFVKAQQKQLQSNCDIDIQDYIKTIKHKDINTLINSETFKNYLQENNLELKPKKKPAKKSNSIEALKSEYPEQFEILKELKPFFPVSVLKSLTNNDIRNWLDALDKLNKIDGYDNETIKKVIKFGRQDDFWQQNVFSISALRKKTDGVQKFAKIKAAADKGKRNGHKKETAESQIEKNKRIDESLYKHFKI